MDEVRAFIISHIEDIKRGFQRSEIRTYAASTGFCMLMSLLPALLVISAILPLTSLDQRDVIDFLLMVFPDSSENLIKRICTETYQAAGGILPVSIIILLWSAGFGMMQLMKGLNSIYEVQEKRNYFLLRLVGTLYMLLVFALMLGILFLQVFAQQLVELWQTAAPYAPPPGILTSALRYVILFVASVVLFLLLYTSMPAKKMNPWNQLPGAIVAAAGWQVLGGLFALYTCYAPHLNAYYGSLTTFVVMLFWMYWSLYIMLFGAFLNRFIEMFVLPLMNGAEDARLSDRGGDDAHDDGTRGSVHDDREEGEALRDGQPASEVRTSDEKS